MTHPPAQPSDGRYQEKAIQLACVEWLSTNQGYIQTFDDRESVGARFDSAGSLGGRLLLIEFKVNVTGPMVRHHPERSGSLESKIAGVLGGLYSGASDELSAAANRIWDRRTAPFIAIAAQSFSPVAVTELVAMLNERAFEWRFDWAVWRWADGAVDEMVSGTIFDLPTEQWLAEVSIPQLVGRTPRVKNLTLDQLRQEADQAGIGALLNAFIDEARRRKMRITSGRRSIRAGYPRSKGGTVCACFLDTSSPELGLNIGLDATRFGEGSALPGSPAPTKGFLNLNRYLQDPRDVQLLFESL